MTSVDEATLILLDMSLEDVPPCEQRFERTDDIPPVCDEPADFLVVARCCALSVYMSSTCVGRTRLWMSRTKAILCARCEAELPGTLDEHYILQPVKP